VLGAFLFGFYFLQVNYAFFVVGLTVAVSQLYSQMGELSNGLLRLRLASPGRDGRGFAPPGRSRA
jgi:hypothetical protein